MRNSKFNSISKEPYTNANVMLNYLQHLKDYAASETPNRIRGDGRGAGGFTLLEVLIVVVILSLLAAYVAPKIIGRTDDAKIAEAKVQIRSLETALKLFKMDNGFYPDTQQGLEVLTEKPSSGHIPQNYKEGGYLEQKKIPLDPWGNPYLYFSPGVHGDYDLLSYGADGKEGGEGKDADIKSWDIQRQ